MKRKGDFANVLIGMYEVAFGFKCYLFGNQFASRFTRRFAANGIQVLRRQAKVIGCFMNLHIRHRVDRPKKLLKLSKNKLRGAGCFDSSLFTVAKQLDKCYL